MLLFRENLQARANQANGNVDVSQLTDKLNLTVQNLDSAAENLKAAYFPFSSRGKVEPFGVKFHEESTDELSKRRNLEAAKPIEPPGNPVLDSGRTRLPNPQIEHDIERGASPPERDVEDR